MVTQVRATRVLQYPKLGRPNEKGFSLVELLIVVSIMAVLGAVAIMALTGLIGTGTPEAKASEKAAVQTAVDAYLSVTNPPPALTARVTAGVVASTDTDAPFKTYIRSLPTKYTYTWDANGEVTQP